MNFELFPDAPLRALVAKLMDGNHGFSELIIPQSRWMSFLFLGRSISVTERILLSGGSKKMTEFSF